MRHNDAIIMTIWRAMEILSQRVSERRSLWLTFDSCLCHNGISLHLAQDVKYMGQLNELNEHN